MELHANQETDRLSISHHRAHHRAPVEEGPQRRLIAPTWIEGLDRLVGGGIRLCHKSPTAPAPAAVVQITGQTGAGKTTLGLHLAAALCRVHGRGVALYLCRDPEEVRALGAAYGDAGFAWVRSGPFGQLPAVATGLLLVDHTLGQASGHAGDGPPRPMLVQLTGPGGPAGPAPYGGPADLDRLLPDLDIDIPRETPLRVVVLDSGQPGPQETAALARLLGRAGISVIVVGEAGDEADVVLELCRSQPETGGRALFVHKTRLPGAHPGPHLLSLSEGGVSALPLPSLYPRLCRPPAPALRDLPLGRFGDPTLDRRAGGQPWLTPQCRVLLYGPDPTCTLLLTNRFLAESGRRLAIFFSAPAARSPRAPLEEGERGTVHLPRACSGAEVVAQVAAVLKEARQRWPQGPAQGPRVALIDPGTLYHDGRHDSSPAVLDAALLSVCGEAGVMALVTRTASELPSWWSDFDLVLHLHRKAQEDRNALVLRVVADRVSR